MAKKTIMIVEDDPAISEMLSINLSKEGYDVLTAGSADEALKVIEEKDVDFFIVDIMLPGSMDGFDLIRILKAVKIISLLLCLFSVQKMIQQIKLLVLNWEAMIM